MRRNSSIDPTDSELAILRIVWSKGHCTVRQVAKGLNAGRRGKPVGYTTALKLMQIMAEKGLLSRDESQRTHIYRAAKAADETRTLRRVLANLIDRAFGGSTHKLVMHALSGKHATPEELARIQELINEMKGDKP